MITIEIKENELFEISLRKFKKMCEKSGIIAEVKKREFYEKPTEIRKKIKSLFSKKKNKKRNKK